MVEKKITVVFSQNSPLDVYYSTQWSIPFLSDEMSDLYAVDSVLLRGLLNQPALVLHGVEDFFKLSRINHEVFGVETVNVERIGLVNLRSVSEMSNAEEVFTFDLQACHIERSPPSNDVSHLLSGVRHIRRNRGAETSE